jgi:hypothetical protein
MQDESHGEAKWEINLRDSLFDILRVRADGWSYPGAPEASKILKTSRAHRMRIGELATSECLLLSILRVAAIHHLSARRAENR